MTTSVCIKRMQRERQTLEKHENGEYCVHFPNDNLMSFFAYVLGPEDSLYRHKFIKLKIDIPQAYPLKSPTVKFIQHSGGRIHPNLYVDGKVCLSILGTWTGEPWATAMTVESVLITIRSLLDNQPFKHEPNKQDDPGYNAYVQYSTRQCLLFDYLEKEPVPELKAFMNDYCYRNSSKMIEDLGKQQKISAHSRTLVGRYDPGRGVIKPDYPLLQSQLKKLVASAKPLPKPASELSDRAHPKNNDLTQKPSKPDRGASQGKAPSIAKPQRQHIRKFAGTTASDAIDLESMPSKKREVATTEVIDLT